jgi:hypothetical protein
MKSSSSRPLPMMMKLKVCREQIAANVILEEEGRRLPDLRVARNKNHEVQTC